MKYFFVSDIHGEYGKLIQALADECFDMEKDTLVSLGDPFDRGFQSKEVLDFILACPHHIIVIGNHDWRLKILMKNPLRQWNQYDIQNGVPATYKSFLGIPQDEPIMAWDALEELSGNEQLHQYFEEAVLYVEFKDFIAVHGWIPHKDINKTTVVAYKGDWHEASRADWYEATWAHTENCIMNNIFPEKRLLVGHWHAWRLAYLFGEKREDFNNIKVFDNHKYTYLNCDMFVSEPLIAIDGCSNWPNGGKVNVFIYETDEQPRMKALKDAR